MMSFFANILKMTVGKPVLLNSETTETKEIQLCKPRYTILRNLKQFIYVFKHTQSMSSWAVNLGSS